MPWTVSADTKGCKFPRWDQNTLAMGIQTEKPSFAASTDLQGLLHELGSPEPRAGVSSSLPSPGPAAAPPPAGQMRVQPHLLPPARLLAAKAAVTGV